MKRFKRFDVLGVAALLVTFLSAGCGTGGSQSAGTSRSGGGGGGGGTAHSVNLTWAASTSLVPSYNVYRSLQSGSHYQFLNQVVDSSPTDKMYTDSTGVSGNDYFYVVTALDINGVESTLSNEVRVHIP